MKKELCEISVRNKSKHICKVIAHCYESGVDGLLVTINYEHSGNTYTLTHAKSGYSVISYSMGTIKRAKQIATMFFSDCDFSQVAHSMITGDEYIIKQYNKAMKHIVCGSRGR